MSAVVTEPGIYTLEEESYHRDTSLAPELGRSLSVSGMKTLLVNPARFAHERDHGRPNKAVFDFGTLAHELILHGGDKRIRVIDTYDWRTKAARDAKQAAYDAGQIPVHRGDLLAAAKVKHAVHRDPLAAAILSTGTPERSIYWTDEATGVTCRGRIDWTHPKALVDVKTVPYGGTDPDALAKFAASYDWPMQAVHYTDGWEALTGDRVPFLFLCVEKEPPYFVKVIQLSDSDLTAGREKVRTALERYADYETNGYPATTADIDTLHLPGWYGR